MIAINNLFFFFFQAEDGIRDHCVTGVQTCALPISRRRDERRQHVATRHADPLTAPASTRSLEGQVAAEPRRPRVVALILAYDVAGLLESALHKIPRQLVDDIFVMDDCSTDGTSDVARRLGLMVYRNEKNLGYGGNLRAGLRRAVRDHAADYVVETHGDGAQLNPAAIATALPLLREILPFIL